MPAAVTADIGMEDALANQDLQLTNTYGGTSGGGSFLTIAGNYIKTIDCYTSYNNAATNFYFLQAVQITYDNGTSITIGNNPPTANNASVQTLTLSGNSIAKLYFNISSNSHVFSGSPVIVGIYAELLNGPAFCSLPTSNPSYCTPQTNPPAWQIATPTGSSMPAKNMVLVGMSGKSGSAINAAAFYFKTDKLMNQGLYVPSYTYSPATPGAATPLNVATATVSNQTNTQQQMSINFSESVASSFTFSVAEGLTIGTTVEVQAGVPLVADAKFTESAQVSFTATLGVSKTFTNTFSYTANVMVGENQTIQAKAVASSYAVSATFTGTYAELWAHAGAVTKTVSGTLEGVTAYDVNVNYTSN